MLFLTNHHATVLHFIVFHTHGKIKFEVECPNLTKDRGNIKFEQMLRGPNSTRKEKRSPVANLTWAQMPDTKVQFSIYALAFSSVLW